MVHVKCKHCGHEWDYTGKYEEVIESGTSVLVTCANDDCLLKTPAIPEDEE